MICFQIIQWEEAGRGVYEKYQLKVYDENIIFIMIFSLLLYIFKFFHNKNLKYAHLS